MKTEYHIRHVLFVCLTCRLKNVFGLHIYPTEAEFKVMFMSMSMYLFFFIVLVLRGFLIMIALTYTLRPNECGHFIVINGFLVIS